MLNGDGCGAHGNRRTKIKFECNENFNTTNLTDLFFRFLYYRY